MAEKGVYFFASGHVVFEKLVIGINIASTPDISYRAVTTCIKTDNNNNTSTSDIRIGTVCNQETRNKTSANTNSTSEVMERTEANNSIQLMKVSTMMMFNEASN